jgi:hypothetical protein
LLFMRRHPLRAASLVTTVCAWLACGSGSGAGDGGGQVGHDARDAGDGGATSWSGSVYQSIVAPDGGTIPIASARVCILERPAIACATTDAEGNYTMTLPPFDAPASFTVTFTAAGHLGRVRAAGHDWWPVGVGLRPDEAAAAEATRAGFSHPPRGTGFIEVRLFDGGVAKGLAGATVTLSPASGMGPIYVDPAFAPDRSLTATSSSGYVWFGNVAPGRVTITVSATGKRCDTAGFTSGIWLDSGPNVISVPVVADSITDDVVLWCW